MRVTKLTAYVFIKEDWAAMGYNESVVHTDIISTENRTVTATLKDGTQMVIYKDGKFTI
jgi:aminopeptidase